MSSLYEDLGHGITRIDTGMIQPELAACYLLESDSEYALIETGTQHTVPIIMALLASRNIDPLQLRYVIPTHVHLDHAGGVGGLMQQLPNATLLIHPRGARHMIEPDKLRAGAVAVYGEQHFREIYGDIIPVAATRVREMQDAEQMKLGRRTLVFYDTPGHARHHFCVHDLQSNGIFSGDTFGLAYPVLTSDKGPFMLPTTTPVQFEPEALKHSIQRLLALKPDCFYLTHYGKVGNPQPLGQQLITQIDAYVAIAQDARQHASDADLEQAIIQRLTTYTLARARVHGCRQTDGQLQQIIAMDMRLNAQGLVVWLQTGA
jgi:glyoxylase-like metal-dependent hydrolase (beta-lactamase superfamily II)